MKLSKEHTIKIAEALRALGHPTRVEMVSLLCSDKGRNISVRQIQETLGLTQSETSRRLIALKNVSVLGCIKRGTNSNYFINKKDLCVKVLVTCLCNSASLKIK